jgi:protein NRD1
MHKSLPVSAKVSSLYAFDALARAARVLVNKHGIKGDFSLEKGNAATFLLKIEGVLDGLFQDMVAIGNAEAKVSRWNMLFRANDTSSTLR